MPYTTAQALIQQFGARELAEVSGHQDLDPVAPENLREIVEDTPDTGEWEAEAVTAAQAALARINDAIATAESAIDMALRTAGYIAPITDTVPALIVSICEDIARYHLHKENPTDAIKDRYRAATQSLDKIARGGLTLSLATNSGGTLSISVSAPDQVFDDDLLSQYAS